jgi:hypothetical protein
LPADAVELGQALSSSKCTIRVPELLELEVDEEELVVEDEPPHWPLLQPPKPVGVDQEHGWNAELLKVHWPEFQITPVPSQAAGRVVQPQRPPELLLTQPHRL